MDDCSCKKQSILSDQSNRWKDHEFRPSNGQNIKHGTFKVALFTRLGISDQMNRPKVMNFLDRVPKEKTAGLQLTKRDSGTGVFPSISQNFYKHIFCRAHPSDCFWHVARMKISCFSHNFYSFLDSKTFIGTIFNLKFNLGVIYFNFFQNKDPKVSADPSPK